MSSMPLAALLPETAGFNDSDHLTLGGCDALELVREFGTPLYVFDEGELRRACRRYLHEFRSRYPTTSVIYAAKAYLGTALARLLAEEGLGLDVVSGGELAIAQAASFPLEQVHFHGNNKGAEELSQALAAGIGRVAVDNFHELDLLAQLAQERRSRQRVLLRLAPGIDPHTHRYLATGASDTKFGFPMSDGQAEKAVQMTLALPSLELRGFHVHLGSSIAEVEPFAEAVRVLVGFAAEARQSLGYEWTEFSAGGGFAIQYTTDSPVPQTSEYAEAIVSTLKQECAQHALALPELVVEPGRSIVGRAGVALYTVGAIKDVPGVRRYVSLDGGMADNIRPAIYGARYQALAAGRVHAPHQERVALCGKYCEAGDVLIWDAELPPLAPGDVVAIPASGAYCLPMASNYNASLRPPVVMVNDGRARAVRRRETTDDLLRLEEAFA